MAAACYIISDNRRGRRENTSERKAEMAAFVAEIKAAFRGPAAIPDC